MRIYDHYDTKSADFDADELNNDTITLADLSEQKIWVAWKEQLNKQGKLTKIPKDPATGDNAKVPSDPSTYGTLDDAIKCSEAMRGKGGVGIVLGPIDNEHHLVGIDLNSCRDPNTETIADWAAEVINRFDTYAEISPSETGIKLFFQIRAGDLKNMHALLGRNQKGELLTRKTFAAGEHREVAMDTARFYAVTGKRLQGCPEILRTVAIADVQWFIQEAGPNYLARHKANGQHKSNSGGGDQSGSGFAFRFLRDRHLQGMSEAAAMDALLNDSTEAGEWARRSDQRQHKRAWDNSNPFPEPETKSFPPKCSLDDLHQVFRKWFGAEYDLDAIDAVLTAIASERLSGDPLWLLLIGGPGAAKTETVQAGAGAGAYVTSTIASEGALLSATSSKSRSKTATGGLLRKIGDHGVLVIKDVTSIISANREIRGQVLAAIREVYDGRWERNVGTDGGQTLTWTGRIIIVGAVTTAWDTAHSVVASMGDRFVCLRINSKSEIGRKSSGITSIRNTGTEAQMREELAKAVGGVIANMSTDNVELTEDEIEKLLDVADIVTMARTAVEHDYRGDVIDAHAPEMPTRFAKQLTQIIRGGVAIGMSRKRAMALAIRCARDSVPPLRLTILLDIAAHPGSRPGDVRRRISKPWTTVKRELEALHMLGLVQCDEENVITQSLQEKTVWHYSLAERFDRTTLGALPAH